jgi:23S rRNA pseudouridine1911/1915/1917 synthase
MAKKHFKNAFLLFYFYPFQKFSILDFHKLFDMHTYPFDVIYEDNHLLIVNKPAGMLVHEDETGDKTLMDYAKEYIKEKYNKPGEVFMGLVHRIDRPVSGLVVLARTSKGLERMNELFRERKVQKAYWAIVRKKPENKKGKLTHWLLKDEKKNIVIAYDAPYKEAQKSELNYRVIGHLNGYTLLEIEPISGRPHQIRVQLAKIGCPIRGDLKYGYPTANKDKSINLHSRKLFFEHPVKKEKMLCIATLPKDPFWEEFLVLDKEKIKPKNLAFRYEG